MRMRGRAFRGSVAIGIALLCCGCQSELYSKLPEKEANEMLALLLRDGLSASKSQAKDGTQSILVEQSQFAVAVNLLKANGLPRTRFSTIDDVFQPSGMIASPVQEQARFIWALGQELSKTVSEIDGVLTARVQVVLPDNDLLKRNPTPSSASVFIRYDDASQVPSLVSQIKMLVANSVQGLAYDKVSVVLVPVPHATAPAIVPPAAPNWDIQAIVGLGGIAVIVALLVAFRKRLTTLIGRIRPARPEPAE